MLLNCFPCFKQKELFKEQKLRSKLEESVARAAEDAQMQINTHAMTNSKMEKLLAGLHENFEATKHGAQTHIVSNTKGCCINRAVATS